MRQGTLEKWPETSWRLPSFTHALILLLLSRSALELIYDTDLVLEACLPYSKVRKSGRSVPYQYHKLRTSKTITFGCYWIVFSLSYTHY
jgi:hypothetical protein